MATIIGAAKRKTGRAQPVSAKPEENQTTISESRYMRDKLSSTATKSVRESSTGMKFKAANPSNDATASGAIRPPAASLSNRIRLVEVRIASSATLMPAAAWANSRRAARSNIML